jgi:hypothetical protein
MRFPSTKHVLNAWRQNEPREKAQSTGRSHHMYQAANREAHLLAASTPQAALLKA